MALVDGDLVRGSAGLGGGEGAEVSVLDWPPGHSHPHQLTKQFTGLTDDIVQIEKNVKMLMRVAGVS